MNEKVADIGKSELTRLREMSCHARLLIVFLRHSGCTFCREMLADLKQQRLEIEKKGYRIVLVHLMKAEKAKLFFENYGLQGLEQISDPAKRLYWAFGLRRGNMRQLFGLKNWVRGVEAGIFKRHGVGLPEGDPFQMSGCFVYQNGKIRGSFIHDYAADRPDYLKLIEKSEA